MSKIAGKMTPKKRAVIEAATRLFAERGYELTDVDTIAEEAGVAKGTIYFHFETKENLFLAVADHGMQRLEEHVRKSIAASTDIVESLRTAGIEAATFFQKHPELVEIMIQERAQFRGQIPDTHIVYRERNRADFENLLLQGVKCGLFKNIDIVEALHVGANMLYGLVVTSCIAGDSKLIRKRAIFAVDLFLDSILAQPRASEPTPRR